MWALGGSLIGLMLAAAPIGIALAGATILVVLSDPMLGPNALFRAFFQFLNSYTLMAIPFFIYAGFLMERTGLIAKLFNFADSLIGWLPGGFAYATLLAAVMFGAISGSSTAMAAAMGIIAYPEMIRRGYPVWMSAGIIACGGGIAILIPPSITLILYGIITEESIVSLFFAGFTPGLMLAISDAIIIVGISLFIKLPAGKFELKKVGAATWDAWPALLMPVCVLGGLYGGVFTPTEAGAAAAGYALLFGLLSGRGKFLKELLPTTQRTINLTAIVYFLLGCVGVFQFLLANKGWPQDIAAWTAAQGFTQMEFLAVLLIVMLFLSMWLTGVAILVLTVPIFFPVALTLGVDPIHLGILAAIAIEMGGVIPPVGLNLFAVSGTTGVPVTKVMKGAIPFLITDGIVLLLMLFFPVLCLWLPDLLIESHFK
ncbi:MAG: TRAP transporter large permease [Alphaproteobacteria bacterium]|jgi:C4-dicarboxylate transporter DctM subunit